MESKHSVDMNYHSTVKFCCCSRYRLSILISFWGMEYKENMICATSDVKQEHIF